MSSVQNTYGDISPRTAAKVEKRLLKRADESMILERFGQIRVIPANETRSIKFRRYNALSNTPKVLQEGVTPDGSALTFTDYTANLTQYGDYVALTDIVLDNHEDPILTDSSENCGQQAGEMLEITRFGKILGGTNVFYAGGVADRAEVVGVFKRSLQRKVTDSLRLQRAKAITRRVKSTADYGTQPISAAYIGIIPVELQSTIKDMPGFVPAEKYGTEAPMPDELGKVENVRYLVSNLMPIFHGEGGDAPEGIKATEGKADVYPILIFGQDAYGITPFKGKNSVELYVRNPKPDSGDPLAQRGSVGWKAQDSALILNDAWIARVEVAIQEESDD